MGMPHEFHYVLAQRRLTPGESNLQHPQPPCLVEHGLDFPRCQLIPLACATSVCVAMDAVALAPERGGKGHEARDALTHRQAAHVRKKAPAMPEPTD